MGLSAARLAGLEVVQLVNETTAAALAFAHDREGSKTVIIVDVGGGGGCVSVANVNDGAVFVVATCGKRLPGGVDFDRRMMAYLRQVTIRNNKCLIVGARSTACDAMQEGSNASHQSMQSNAHNIVVHFFGRSLKMSI